MGITASDTSHQEIDLTHFGIYGLLYYIPLVNYRRHYQYLIGRAKKRILDDYSERHHIIPRCLGGSDSHDNLVDLTAEEHFVAHLLLVKIYPNNSALAYAMLGMTRRSRTHGDHRNNNKMYGWVKRLIARKMCQDFGKSVVRLSDRMVFDSLRKAARENDNEEIGRVGIMNSIKFGRFHRDSQYMFYSDWINSGKPDVHPQSPFHIVRLSDSMIFDDTNQAAITMGSSISNIRKVIQTGYAINGEYLMRHREWLAAGKPVIHPRSYEPLRARGNTANHDSRFKGKRAMRHGRIVRLSDDTIFDNSGCAALAVDGTQRGIQEACRRGTLHRDHRFMRYEEWTVYKEAV